MKRVSLMLLAMVFAISMAVVGCAGGPPPEGEVITLTFANFPPAPTFPCIAMERWVDEVEARTGGKVKIDTFPGGTLLPSKAMFDGVKDGVADIGCDCPSYDPGRFPLIVGMETPLVKYCNTALASRVLWEVVQEFDPTVTGLADFKLLYVFTAGPNSIVTIDQVNTLEDLAGLRLRCSGAVTPIMQALGAAPDAMPQSDVPDALAKGRLDGYVSSLETMLDFHYTDYCKYWTDWSPSIGCSFAVVMNKDVWNSLPADVQQVMDDLRVEQSVWTGQYMDTHTDESIAWAITQGAQETIISPEEKARWDAAIEGVTDTWLADMATRGLPGEEYLQKLADLCTQYSGEYCE